MWFNLVVENLKLVLGRRELPWTKAIKDGLKRLTNNNYLIQSRQ